MFRILRAVLNTKCIVLALIFSAQAPVAKAATTVFADPSLSCAGFTPCYATIQEAINNAGPGSAEVGIFPGVYAENVDLSLMGSAIAAQPGDLVLQALNAAGGGTDSGVLIDPDGPGGSGTGVGLTTGLAAEYVGSVALFGLAVTSPDTTAMGFQLQGNLTIADLVVDNAASSGLLAIVDGDISAQRVNASMNGGSGVALGSTGSIVVRDIEATMNGSTGFASSAEQDLDAQRIVASENENGVELFVCQNAEISELTANLNQFNGASIFYGPDDCAPAGPVRGQDFWSVLEYGSPYPTDVIRGGSTSGALLASDFLAEGNGGVGIGTNSSTGSAVLNNLTARDNTGIGLIVISPDIEWTSGESTGNESGIFVLADQLQMSQMVANQNLDAMGGGGFGIGLAANMAALDNLDVNSNSLAGLVLSAVEDGFVPDYSVVDSQFEGNPIGILSESAQPLEPDNLLDLRLDTVDLNSNSDAGLSLAALHNGVFRNVVFNSSAIGLDVSVRQQLQVETAIVARNTTGMLVRIEPGAIASVGCSDFTQNLDAGLELIQGSSMSATFNYWDDASGPIHPGNPGGVGDRVLDGSNGGVGSVDYSNFLAQPATDAECPELLIEAVPVPVIGTTSFIILMLGFLIFGCLQLKRVHVRN